MTRQETRDVIIIGAGIVGCMVARELTRYCGSIAILESSSDVGEGSTRANSGIIQTGFQARGGSLKGVSCVQGNKLYQTIAYELDVPFRRIGALLVAFGEAGMDKIYEKKERAAQSGAGDLPVISGEEARELEPRLSRDVHAALLAKSTGIISPFELVQACARNAVSNGAALVLNAEVVSIERSGSHWKMHTKDGRCFRSRFVVNAAGEAAALLDVMVHPADIIVRPRRGQYLVFDKQDVKESGRNIKHVLFQAAESDEGGALLAPTIDGNILVGPTSENVRSFGNTETTPSGIEHIERVAKKIIPDIELKQVITNFAGVRANIVNIDKKLKDFVARVSATNFVSLLGIKNPGMTSAPYLARLVVELLAKEGLALEPNVKFDPRAQGGHQKPFMQGLLTSVDQLSLGEQRLVSERGAGFDRIVCRCEHITEGDVRACLHEAVPPQTLDGVKRRLRIGMGRCQGGHCTPRVIAIMADELGCLPEDIKKSERGGSVVKRAVK